MNKYLFLLFTSCFLLAPLANAQQISSVPVASIDPRITEVFGNQTQTLVANDRDRLKGLTTLLNERIKYVYSEEKSDEKYVKLSTVPLFNKYNPELQRDLVFDQGTFNVLKYNLPFFSQYKKIYRIDNSNYLLIIHPQIIK